LITVARLRTAAGIGVLAALGWLGANLIPIYWRNLELQRFVERTAQQPGNDARADGVLRARVVEKAQDLRLPVRYDDVRVVRSETGLRIDVRYVARVDLPLYTVNLHFYPGAGSR
jgi:hypothetical protein